MAERVPLQGEEETGLQCLRAAEITCLAFSSPPQGSFGLEAGRGEQDLSLPSSAAASGARAESGCPEGAVSLPSCRVAEHKALGGEQVQGEAQHPFAHHAAQDPSKITLCSPQLFIFSMAYA